MPLRHLPIQRKLVGFIFATSLTVLMGSLLFLFWYETVSFERSTREGLATTGNIIAANSSAALIFDDPKVATEILGGLRSEPEISAAALYDKKGSLYAVYQSALDHSAIAPHPQSDGSTFSLQNLVMFQPVLEGNSRVGTLYIKSDLGGMYRRLGVYGAVLVSVLIGAAILTYFLSNFFQRQISRPIIDLAETARIVSERKDYSVRAVKRSGGELGFVTEAFNSMLDQIHASDSALRSSELQMRLVTDHAAVFLCQLDGGHRFKFVNRAYAKRYNREAADIVGRHLSEVIGPDAYAAVRGRLEQALTGSRQEFELDLPYVPLGQRRVHMVYEPERDAGGRVIGVVAALADITERWRAEKELERARDEAVTASRAKDDFLAALSHELRTPLSPVLLLATEAAENRELAPEVRADFEIIRKNVELEARLIDDLLDLTRITKGKMMLEKRRVSPQAILRDALATMRAEFEAKHLKVALDLDAETAQVQGDPVRLQQVFWNVLKNAAKFTPEGGAIALRAALAEDRRSFTVQVTDTGIGISAEELGRVFDAFSQGDHARGGGSHRFGGLGLGLAISKKVIELHSGRISATSPGRDHGSTFVIELPLAPAGETAMGRAESPAAALAPKPAAAPSSAAPARALLLIEDHAPTRVALERLLVRRNYRVISAGSVAEAQLAVEREQVEMVISDIGLPDGNGYDLMAELRQRYPVKGIALTGYGMESDIARSQRAGFIAHLTKPVTVQALEQALAAMIAAPTSR
jgi:PAS domain S-box-containing protein